MLRSSLDMILESYINLQQPSSSSGGRHAGGLPFPACSPGAAPASKSKLVGGSGEPQPCRGEQLGSPEGQGGSHQPRLAHCFQPHSPGLDPLSRSQFLFCPLLTFACWCCPGGADREGGPVCLATAATVMLSRLGGRPQGSWRRAVGEGR